MKNNLLYITRDSNFSISTLVRIVLHSVLAISSKKLNYVIMLSSLRSYFKVWAVAGKNEGNRVDFRYNPISIYM